MDDKEYVLLADQCLERVADWLEEFDPDEVDYAASDGVLKLEFGDGQVFVINRQAGAHQMWFAAGASAWHYDWNGSSWVDDRDGHDLYANVSKQVSDKLGRSVSVS